MTFTPTSQPRATSSIGAKRSQIVGTLCSAMLFAMLAPAPAPAADTYTFNSRHYAVTTDVDRALAKEIAAHMDAVYAEYAGRLSGFRRNVRAGVRENQRMPLYVLGTYEDYQAYLAEMGVNGANTAGVFFRTPKGSGLATWVKGQSRQRMYHVLQHEGFHQFADAKISSLLPPWVNEGLAEYFGDAVMVKGRLQIGRADGRRLRKVQQAIRDRAYVNFRELLMMDGRDWVGRVNAGDRQSGMMYDMAWSVVHFLVHGGRGRYRPALEEYLEIMNRGSDAKVAFDQVFGKNVDAFEAAWARETAKMEPDPWQTSVNHVERVAEALRALHEAGAQVTSFDDLKRELERRGVRIAAPTAHGGEDDAPKAKGRGMKAGQEEGGGEPEDGGLELDFPAPAVAEIVPAKDPKLPPGIVVKKVSPEIVLTWKSDKDGKPQAEIGFGK